MRAHARGAQPAAAARAATTSSSRTGRWSRRSSARAAAGPRAARQRAGRDRRRRGARVGPAGEREPARAAHPRPLRPPHRRGRVPPVLAQAAGRRRLARAALAALDRATARRARRARGAVHDCMGQAEGGHLLPDLDDLLGRAGAARDARAGGGVGAAPDVDLLRPAPGATPPTRPARCAAWR